MGNIFWIEGNSRKEWLLDRQKGQRRIEMSKLEGWEKVVRQAVSPSDPSRTLPVGGGLLVPCSLPGPPVIK